MTSGMFFEFHTRNHAVVNLHGLVTILVLSFARVSLLKLQKQGAKIGLPNGACHLAQMSEDLYNKGSCPRTIHNFGTASYQMPSYKLVLNGDFVVQKSENCEVVGSH